MKKAWSKIGWIITILVFVSSLIVTLVLLIPAKEENIDYNPSLSNSQVVSANGYDYVNYINDLSFSIRSTSSTNSYLYGTGWLLAPVEDGQTNAYDYYMMTNAHVQIGMAGTPSNKKELKNVQFSFCNIDISDDNFDSQYIDFNDQNNTVTFNKDTLGKDVKTVYSNFDFLDFDSQQSKLDDNKNMCYQTDDVPTNCKADASIIEVDFSSKVSTCGNLKAKLDNVNSNYFTDQTRYENVDNISTIPLLDTKSIMFDSKSNTINESDVAPDINNDGKNNLYVLGFPYDQTIGVSKPKVNYAEVQLEPFSNKNIGLKVNNHNVCDDQEDNSEYNTYCGNIAFCNNQATNMQGGSSGSIVINENYDVVGIYWGYTKYTNKETNVVTAYYGCFNTLFGTIDKSQYDFLYSFLKYI